MTMKRLVGGPRDGEMVDMSVGARYFEFAIGQPNPVAVLVQAVRRSALAPLRYGVYECRGGQYEWVGEHNQPIERAD